MGYSRYDDADYSNRVTQRKATNTPTFAYDAAVRSGKTAAKVHDSLNPHGVQIRESRDSNGQEKVPIIVSLDLTGSMGTVPSIVQGKLPQLMGGFLSDKASGKKYLGENGYPDILIAGHDDCKVIGKDSVQIGQFESDIKIDDDITNLWITGNGGGNGGESYDLMLYFAARHTAHDHFDKRRKKGYLFLLGDEPVFGTVLADEVEMVFGDKLESNIPTASIIKEVQKRYHIIWGYPTGHGAVYGGDTVPHWKSLFGQERVIEFDPQNVCQFIVGCVAAIESGVTASELEEDGIAIGDLSKALAPLAAGAVATSALPDLPAVSGKGGAKRL